MRDRESQVGDAGFEVVHEAADVLSAIIGNDVGCELSGNRSARRLVDRLRAGLEIRPNVFRHFGRQVAHAMGQAPLPRRAWKASLDRFDDARSAIRGHQERIVQATPLHVLEEQRSPSRYLLWSPPSYAAARDGLRS
jgi:hypothetical protein